MHQLKNEGREYDDSRHQYREESVGVRSASNSSNHQSYLTTEHERVLVMHPGESRVFTFDVYGPVGHTIKVEAHGFPRTVALLEVNPVQSRAPFSVEVVVSALENASPGVYSWDMTVIDIEEEAVLGFLPVKLVILPSRLHPRVYEYLRSMRKSYGVQIPLLIALRTSYSDGARFSKVKTLYELLAESRVKKGTVGNMLSTMLRKGMIVRTNDGLYRAIEMNIDELLAHVDTTRVRARSSVKTGLEYIVGPNIEKLPWEVRQAYDVARKIRKEHGALAALYFLLHTLLGARRTGFLLLWDNDWFIICENKTHFCHYYYSLLLNTLLRDLGLMHGVYYPVKGEHEEAKKTAETYIHEYYGGYRNARRLHYLLREHNYLGNFEEDQPYVIKIYHDADDNVSVEVYDYTGRKRLASYGTKGEITEIEAWVALPVMHIDERNEDTYFKR